MSKGTKALPTGLWKDEATGAIGMDRCPKCKRENYCMNVLRGICTWCGYDANSDYGASGRKAADRQDLPRTSQQ